MEKAVLPEMDYSKYRGEWVVICKDKIVAHGNDLVKLRGDIGKCRTQPTIVKIPKHDTLIF